MHCMPAYKDIMLGEDAYVVLHQVYVILLGKLKAARKYIDVGMHGPMKLTAYFGVMSYCLVSRMEKIMDVDRKYSGMLLECSYLVDYMDLVLLDERETLINDNVHQFFLEYFPKVEGCKAVKALGGLIAELEEAADEVCLSGGPVLGDVRSLQVLLPRAKLSQRDQMLATLTASLHKIINRIKEAEKDKEGGDNKKEEEQVEKVEADSSESPVEVEKVSEAMAVGETPAAPTSYQASLCTASQLLLQIIQDNV